MALAFVASVMLARILGAEQRGVYALAILVPNTMYVFGTFGLSTAHILYAGKNAEKRGTIAFQSFAFAALMGLLTLLFYAYLFMFEPAWFNRFRVAGTSNLILASFLVFLQLAWILLRSGIQGANRIQTINIGNIVLPLIRVLFILILVGMLGLGVSGGIIALLGSFVFIVLFMTGVTAAKVPIKSWRADYAFFKKSFSLGVKVHLNHIALYVVNTIGKYMIVFLLPDSEKALGQYVVVAQFTLILLVLPQSLQMVLLPHLSVTKSDKAKLAAKGVRVLFWGLLPIFTALVIASPLIKVLLGQDYEGAILPFMFFIPGIFFYSTTGPIDSYLLHIEKPMYTAVISWSAALLNIILNLLLIPRMHIAGAAFALTVSYLVMSIMRIVFFVFVASFPLHNLVPRWTDLIEVIKHTTTSLVK